MGSGGLWHPALTRWVDDVERAWSAGGVPAVLRERLRSDLVTDLAQARAGGATVEELVSTPPERFATDVATAEGIEVVARPLRPRPKRRLRDAGWAPFVAGLEGLVAGVLVSVFVVYPLAIWFSDAYLPDHPDPWGLTLVAHAVAFSVTLGSAGLAIRLILGRSPRAGRRALTSVAALAASGTLALVAAVSYASTTDFSTRPSVVAVEVVIVAVCCLGGLVAASILAGRRERPGPVLERAPAAGS